MDTINPVSSRSRRALLLGMLGGLAATAAHAIGRPFPASAGHDETNVMHLGEENVSAAGAWATTFISNGALVVGGEGHAHGFEGGGDDIGVWGQSNTGIGVLGASWDGGGVIGEGGSIPKDPEDRAAGPGVIGIAPGDAPGVLAQSMTMETRVLDGGLALDVVGKARFSTVGTATVAAGQESVLVTDAAATADSHIMVTLVGDPGGRSVRWVSRAAGSLIVHLTSAPANKRRATPFTYLIVEPG